MSYALFAKENYDEILSAQWVLYLEGNSSFFTKKYCKIKCSDGWKILSSQSERLKN